MEGGNTLHKLHFLGMSYDLWVRARGCRAGEVLMLSSLGFLP